MLIWLYLQIKNWMIQFDFCELKNFFTSFPMFTLVSQTSFTFYISLPIYSVKIFYGGIIDIKWNSNSCCKCMLAMPEPLPPATWRSLSAQPGKAATLHSKCSFPSSECEYSSLTGPLLNELAREWPVLNDITTECEWLISQARNDAFY